MTGLLRAALVRAAVLGTLWWAVAEGAGTGWGLGLVVVALAVVSSLWLQPPGGPAPRLRAVPGFLAWFVGQSLLGGVDVARRSLRRPVDVAPDVVEVPVALPAGWPSVVLADAVSLLPGTLAVRLRRTDDGGQVLDLHVLDTGAAPEVAVAALEQRVARLFGVEQP